MAFYAAKRAHEPTHVMARTDFYSWGPGNTFRAAVFAIHDVPEGLKEGRITARLLDGRLTPLLDKTWGVDVPGGGRKSDDREIAWLSRPTRPSNTLPGIDPLRFRETLYFPPGISLASAQILGRPQESPEVEIPACSRNALHQRPLATSSASFCPHKVGCKDRFVSSGIDA